MSFLHPRVLHSGSLHWWLLRPVWKAQIAWSDLEYRVRYWMTPEVVVPPLGEREKVLTQEDWYGAMERVSLEALHDGDGIPMWNLVIAHWPADRRTATGLRSEWRRSRHSEALLMDGELRAIALGLLEELFRTYDTHPPTRDRELLDLIEDVQWIVSEHDPIAGYAPFRLADPDSDVKEGK